MIWALLEITLPLCLAFLLGMTGGWLLWRWRRRYINASEWNENNDNVELQLLRAEYEDVKEMRDIEASRIKALEGKVETQSVEMRAMDTAARALTDELEIARKKPDPTPVAIDNSAELKELKEKLAEEAKKATDAEAKTAEFSGRVDHQAQLNNELQEKLKQSESVASERDTAINRIKDLESALALSGQEETALTEAKEELSVVQKKFKNYQASVISDRQNSDQEKEKLQSRISELESQISSSAENENIIRELEQKNTTLVEQLKAQSDASAQDKSNISQLESQVLELNRRSAEVDRTISALSEMKQEKVRLQTRITELESTLSERNTALSESASLTSELTQAKTTIAENDEEKSELNSRIAELESQLQSARQQTAAANTAEKGKLEGLQRQLNQANNEASEEKSELNSRITALESQLQSERQQTAAANTAEKGKLEDLQRQLDQAINEASEEKSELNSRITALESQLQSARQQAAAANATENGKLEDLKRQLDQANNAASQLNQAKANMATLNTQLNEARMKIAQSSEAEENLSSTNRRNNELSRENEELKRQAALTQTTAPESRQELRELQRKYAEVTAQFNEERRRSQRLASELVNKSAAVNSPVTQISEGQLKKLKAQNASKDKHIAELEKKLKNKSAKRKQKNAWQKGTTKLGTPGSDHKDDLTAINGIGPKIEKVLNKLGIKSWEQLACMSAAEVTMVDQALEDFPGRIKRDKWVSQAKAIIRNGHRPVKKNSKTKTKSAKKPKRSKSSKKAWQQGETRFGTPGSIHRDDLKVINGIGPVIEKALNRRGIRAWEQLATLKAQDVKNIDEALDFPGRIKREEWVQQAKALVKQFPDQKDRPTRSRFLNKVANG